VCFLSLFLFLFLLPVTFRVDKTFVGAYVSLADVLQAHVASGGKALQAPGQGNNADITNVVPLFDDERIHVFLRKYAPSLLEYTASIGMRRVIANVPMTHSFTICAGLWKLVQDLDVDRKTEVHMTLFTKLCTTYKIAVGKYFDHLLPLISGELYATHCSKAAQEGKPRPSYYLAHSGVTIMVRPLMELAHQMASGKHVTGDKLVAPMLRALFSFETWQVRVFSHTHHTQTSTQSPAQHAPTHTFFSPSSRLLWRKGLGACTDAFHAQTGGDRCICRRAFSPGYWGMHGADAFHAQAVGGLGEK
jgi:hypothetical protein